MTEMQISTPLDTKTVDDYDFTFISGLVMPITLDPVAGDTITFGNGQVHVHLVGKPSLKDPQRVLPAEDIILYETHIAAVQKRQRELVGLTPEQQFQWAKTIEELGKVH